MTKQTLNQFWKVLKNLALKSWNNRKDASLETCGREACSLPCYPHNGFGVPASSLLGYCHKGCGLLPRPALTHPAPLFPGLKATYFLSRSCLRHEEAASAAFYPGGSLQVPTSHCRKRAWALASSGDSFPLNHGMYPSSTHLLSRPAVLLSLQVLFLEVHAPINHIYSNSQSHWSQKPFPVTWPITGKLKISDMPAHLKTLCFL